VTWINDKKRAAERDNSICQSCRLPATDVHHRKVKGMGGSHDQSVHSLANLICLCRNCHDYIHAHPLESYGFGFLVRNGDDPEKVPVWFGRQYRMWLSADGGKKRESNYGRVF
jgi:5-methylcytosine-specific restriction protein A